MWCIETNGEPDHTYKYRPGITLKDYNSRVIYWRKGAALARLAKWRAWGVDCDLYECELDWKPTDE